MRINIVGPCGSGKSTLARQLSSILAIQQYHMDQLFFNPNWEEKSRAELRKGVSSNIESSDEWIIDGNYTDTLPMRLADSTLVIILDYPRYIYFWQVLNRIIKNMGQVRPDMAPDCPERLDFGFLKYVWHWDKEKKEALFNSVFDNIKEDTKVLHFKQPRQADSFISSLKSTLNKN